MLNLNHEKLLKILHLLNKREIERICGFRKDRLYDCQRGVSTLNDDEMTLVAKALFIVFNTHN